MAHLKPSTFVPDARPAIACVVVASRAFWVLLRFAVAAAVFAAVAVVALAIATDLHLLHL